MKERWATCANLLHVDFLHPIFRDYLASVLISITDVGHQVDPSKATLKKENY